MCSQKYFVDSCIWLNLFKKEGDKRKGKPHYIIARDFFLAYEPIIFSNLVLRELRYVLKNTELFVEKESFMKNEFTFVQVTSSDYTFARKIEGELGYSISFYDCMHIATARRLDCILITRDNDLLICASKYVTACKPEDLL